MIPDPKGNPMELIIQISIAPARLGRPGMIKLLMMIRAIPPKNMAKKAPFKLGFGYFLK